MKFILQANYVDILNSAKAECITTTEYVKRYILSKCEFTPDFSTLESSDNNGIITYTVYEICN